MGRLLPYFLFFCVAPLIACAETQFLPTNAGVIPPENDSTAVVHPLVGTRVSSGFGMRNHPVIRKRRHHHGLDLAAPHEAPVRSVQSGRVIYADPHGGYGNLVVVQHENGVTTHYGHLHSIRVKTGMILRAGSIIGEVGSTGRVTGPHLHFEVRKNGTPLNPLHVFPSIAQRGEG
ncbi:M23 family metallopeptidase [bacterium]|nr:M23 family metallopeptidase [bacterium]